MAYAIKIEGITKEKPHNDIIILTIFKFLCLFRAKANGIAKKQQINAEKKA